MVKRATTALELLSTKLLSVSLHEISDAPVYELRADVGTVILYRWTGSVLSSGIEGLAVQLKYLAENLKEIDE
jgi:hypothetical protein